MSRTLEPARSLLRAGFVFVLLTVFAGCASVPTDLQESRLSFERSAFSGYKYTFDGSEPEGVLNFWGFYNSSYTDLLSQQPEALETAKSAEGFMWARTGVLALTTVYAVSELIAATGTDDSLAGTVESSDHLNRAVGAMIGGLLWQIILGIPITNRVHDSAREFNTGLSSPDAGQPGSAVGLLPESLWVDPSTGRLDMGWRLRR